MKDWLLQETRGSLWQRYKLTKISTMMVKSAHDRQLFPHLNIYAPVADSPTIQGECTPTCPDFPKPRTSEEPAMFTPGNIVPLLLRQKKTPAGLWPFLLGFFKGAVVVPVLPQSSQWQSPEAGDCSSTSLHNAQTSIHRMCRCKTSPTLYVRLYMDDWWSHPYEVESSICDTLTYVTQRKVDLSPVRPHWGAWISRSKDSFL